MRRIFTLISLLICAHFSMFLTAQGVSLCSSTFGEDAYTNELSDNGIWVKVRVV